MGDLAFTDTNDRADLLGGAVTWSVPDGSAGSLTQYAVYLGADSSGSGALQLLGTVSAPGNTSLTLTPNTAVGDGLSYVLVFCVNGEWSAVTPTALELDDIWLPRVGVASASVTFSDTDIDEEQIGGTVTWEAPSAAALTDNGVSGYTLYLADAASISNATASAQLGTVAITDGASLSVPSNTDCAGLSHVLIYTRSEDGLQTDSLAPAALLLLDEASRNMTSVEATAVVVTVDASVDLVGVTANSLASDEARTVVEEAIASEIEAATNSSVTVEILSVVDIGRRTRRRLRQAGRVVGRSGQRHGAEGRGRALQDGVSVEFSVATQVYADSSAATDEVTAVALQNTFDAVVQAVEARARARRWHSSWQSCIPGRR